MGIVVTNFHIDISPQEAAYLDKCARIRGVAPNSLVKRLLKTICRDQLVLSILDDDSAPGIRAGERSYSEKRLNAARARKKEGDLRGN